MDSILEINKAIGHTVCVTCGSSTRLNVVKINDTDKKNIVSFCACDRCLFKMRKGITDHILDLYEKKSRSKDIFLLAGMNLFWVYYDPVSEKYTKRYIDFNDIPKNEKNVDEFFKFIKTHSELFEEKDRTNICYENNLKSIIKQATDPQKGIYVDADRATMNAIIAACD